MPRTTDPDGAIFEQLRPRLTALSCRIVGSRAEAEEIVQDCYLQWHAADRKALATPAAWLTTVVQHRSIDRLRRRARDEEAALAAMELQPLAAAPALDELLLRRAELGAAYTSLLRRLSPSERLALVLHEVFECSHADIAAVLGTKAATARQHLARARRRLRTQEPAMAPEERLCRELIRRFQAAIHGMDLPAVLTLLADEQPLSVQAAPPVRLWGGPSANEACYRATRAA